MNVDQANQSLLAIAQAQNLTAQSIAAAFGRFVSVPANSAAPGSPGQCSYDATSFYLCVGPSSWLKFAGSTF